jgi:hypothetical protein
VQVGVPGQRIRFGAMELADLTLRNDRRTAEMPRAALGPVQSGISPSISGQRMGRHDYQIHDRVSINLIARAR